MFRLTTPQHTFSVNVDPTTWSEFRITYQQDVSTVLEKTEADFSSMTVTEIEEGKEWTLSYYLTQAETAQFKSCFPVRIQIRCLTNEGYVSASRIITVPVEDVLNHDFLGA